jgi:hypothetical protein
MIKFMLRKIILLLIAISFILTSRASATESDFGFGTETTGFLHRDYFVMNTINDGIFYDNCFNYAQTVQGRKLQIKVKSGKKFKWKTVANATFVMNQFNFPKGYTLRCTYSQPFIAIFQWIPTNYQIDYEARILNKYNSKMWSGSIVIHPDLKAIKP